jgi:hypothetical protein
MALGVCSGGEEGRVNPQEFDRAVHDGVGRRQTEYRGNPGLRANDWNDHHWYAVSELGAHKARWAAANVDVRSRRANVQVFLNFKQGDLSHPDYARLRTLAQNGIHTYWSRAITLRDERFMVDVSVVHRTSGAIGVKLAINNDPEKYSRSHNMAMLGIDARFTYNAGWFGNQRRADMNFMLVAAHEFGHSVLMEFGGIGLSWSHESSTEITQNTKGSTPGYPQAGSINLMKYYDAEKAAVAIEDEAARTVASELDVKRLIWMSKLAVR